MKTILVASDLSARSDRAIARAALLAEQHQAKLMVLHVVDEELPVVLADRQAEDADRSVRTALASLPHAAALSSDVRIVVGEHYQTILAEAETVEADLVVIGQHRKDILLDLFRGSTGERILRFGNRPVLVAKSAASHRYVSMLGAVDFSPPSRRAIEVAVTLAPGADIKLVHAFDIPFRGLLLGGASMEQLAKKHQRQFQDMVEAQTQEFLQTLSTPIAPQQVIAREGAPEETVLAVAAETRSDLLVIGTHGRSGLGRALLGSVAEGLLARAPCDVLAVRGW
jgi:nucleotide-binding universal stress UspA family protein